MEEKTYIVKVFDSLAFVDSQEICNILSSIGVECEVIEVEEVDEDATRKL